MRQFHNGGRLLKFGVFELDVESRELRKSGMRLKLAGQPLQVLEVLVLRSGEVVSKEELRQQIWGNNTFVDHELALKKAVNRIRVVLGDSAENPRFIETLPRHGYRFLLAVSGNGTSQTALTEPDGMQSRILGISPFSSVAESPGSFPRPAELRNFLGRTRRRNLTIGLLGALAVLVMAWTALRHPKAAEPLLD
jgi:DNA-binding winged helix-turn-helix (wHTH) protein